MLVRQVFPRLVRWHLSVVEFLCLLLSTALVVFLGLCRILVQDLIQSNTINMVTTTKQNKNQKTSFSTIGPLSKLQECVLLHSVGLIGQMELLLLQKKNLGSTF
jgi:hypothetical protein